MKLFYKTRTKRISAFVVLWVWLFAFASGVANACLVQTGEAHDHSSLAASSHNPKAEGARAISVVHDDAIFDHDSGQETSKSQCLKVCDDGSQSLPKQQVGFDLAHVDLTPLFASAWKVTTSVVTARGLFGTHRPPNVPLPIRIRLSRLAL